MLSKSKKVDSSMNKMYLIPRLNHHVNQTQNTSLNLIRGNAYGNSKAYPVHTLQSNDVICG